MSQQKRYSFNEEDRKSWWYEDIDQHQSRRMHDEGLVPVLPRFDPVTQTSSQTLYA